MQTRPKSSWASYPLNLRIVVVGVALLALIGALPIGHCPARPALPSARARAEAHTRVRTASS